jgi:hypothetical protein
VTDFGLSGFLLFGSQALIFIDIVVVALDFVPFGPFAGLGRV